MIVQLLRPKIIIFLNFQQVNYLYVSDKYPFETSLKFSTTKDTQRTYVGSDQYSIHRSRDICERDLTKFFKKKVY
jgi:hypothetical protein